MMGLSLSIPEGKEYDPIKAAADVAQLMEHHRKRLDRAIELYDLEQQGRLVVLPCKVGDTVYIAGHKFAARIDEITINEMDGVAFAWSEYDRGPELTELWDDGWFKPEDIGKTVFLTREEAEAALRGEDNAVT